MIELGTIREMCDYARWANARLVDAAQPLDDERLDRRFPMGPGSLRRTLLHILVGEEVWLRRCRGEVETPWAGQGEAIPVDEMRSRFEALHRERASFLDSLDRPRLDWVQTYRDSKGGLFSATLGRMLLQMCLHSHHHRAQAVNMLRQLGAEAPELDYMMHVRREPAPAAPPVTA